MTQINYITNSPVFLVACWNICSTWGGACIIWWRGWGVTTRCWAEGDGVRDLDENGDPGLTPAWPPTPIPICKPHVLVKF